MDTIVSITACLDVEDMHKIVSSFTADTALNDVLVHRFVCRV